jgi:hypothetical protein
MLIALMTVYLLGGGSLEPFFDKQTRSAIKQSVNDEARQKEVLATIKSIEGSRKSATKAAKGSRKELADLEAGPSAAVNDIEAELEKIVGTRNGLHEAFVDGVFDMRENMTAEEWQAVFGSDS